MISSFVSSIKQQKNGNGFACDAGSKQLFFLNNDFPWPQNVVLQRLICVLARSIQACSSPFKKYHSHNGKKYVIVDNGKSQAKVDDLEVPPRTPPYYDLPLVAPKSGEPRHPPCHPPRPPSEHRFL